MRFPLLFLLAALALAPALRAQSLRVEPLGCDSLRLTGDGSGWDRLEEDAGDGWGLWADAGRLAAGLVRPAPAVGRAAAWRLLRRDRETGLPVYSREWTWTRPWPELEARLEGGGLSWSASGDCQPDRLELRLYDGDRPVDLRTVDAESLREPLPAEGWTSLRLGWPGQPSPLELLRPGARLPKTVAQLPPPPPAVVPLAPPTIVASGEGWVELEHEGWLISGTSLAGQVDRGGWSVEQLGDGRSRVTLETGSGENWIACENAEGRRSLPVLVVFDKPAAPPSFELSGPDGLVASAGEAPAGSVWHWVDGAGSAGSRSADRPLELAGLAGPLLHLQLVGPDGASLWDRRITLEWTAPPTPVWTSQGLRDGRLTLIGKGQWTPDALDLEIRRPDGVERLSGPLPLPLPSLAADTSWTLRWRGRLRSSSSEWSQWTTLSLQPDPPSGVRASAGAAGVSLVAQMPPLRSGRNLSDEVRASGERGPWLQDGFEWRRIASGDTLELGFESEGQFVDGSAPPGMYCRYEARRVAGDRLSAWSKPAELYAPDDGRGWIPGPGGRWSPRLLRVAEVAQLLAESGLQVDGESVSMPATLPVEGQENWFRDGHRPMVGLSYQQAQAVVELLNRRMGFKAGGPRFHLPPAGAVAPAGLATERFELREWRERVLTLSGEDVPLVAGSSWLRGPAPAGSSAYQSAPVDVGIRLLLDLRE